MNEQQQATQGTESAPWTASITDETLRGYVQNKGFQGPEDLAKSYLNLEKLMGAPKERILKLPETNDAPEWGEIWGKLGRPEDPKGYELQFDGDASFADRFAGVMHKAGIPKPAAQALNAEWNNYVSELMAEEQKAQEARTTQEMQQLRQDWGKDFETHVEFSRRAGREFGLNEDQFKAIEQALGPLATMKLFHGIGSKVGEAKPFHAGNGAGSQFSMTREQAMARRQALMNDRDWSARFLNGGANERAEMDKLVQAIAGG